MQIIFHATLGMQTLTTTFLHGSAVTLLAIYDFGNYILWCMIRYSKYWLSKTFFTLVSFFLDLHVHVHMYNPDIPVLKTALYRLKNFK